MTYESFLGRVSHEGDGDPRWTCWVSQCEVGILLDLSTRNWVSHEGGGDSHWTCPQRNWDSHEDYPQIHGCPSMRWKPLLDLTTRNWVSHEGGGIPLDLSTRNWESHWTCPQRDWDSHEDYPQTHGHPTREVGIPVSRTNVTQVHLPFIWCKILNPVVSWFLVNRLLYKIVLRT